MCFGPPDLIFLFDLTGYGQVGKMAIILRNVYSVICEKQEAMVRTFHLTKSLIIGAKSSLLVNILNLMNDYCRGKRTELLTCSTKNGTLIKKTSTKGLSPAPPRKGTHVLDDEPEKEPPRKCHSEHRDSRFFYVAAVCSLRNEIMNYVFWCLPSFEGYPLLAKLNVPPNARSRDIQSRLSYPNKYGVEINGQKWEMI
ncbi:hypothetical protein C4D60_Mb05t29730 [Musa balbisiana]|uniref:Uncharacterized protein n=1 Tax=Musa balbisiana TaxID=52838 RepID=A0A4S8JZX6_MUSBA|nr:hypothetical protein C4D60_Mb05t29730 [Musa balbisiana]